MATPRGPVVVRPPGKKTVRTTALIVMEFDIEEATELVVLDMEASAAPIVVDGNDFAFVYGGLSGMVYNLDADRVVKHYYDPGDVDARVEREVFRRLGEHPYIVRCLGWTIKGSLVAERGECLRFLFRREGPAAAAAAAPARAWSWICQAALGVQHLHRRGIVHADVGCHNMVLMRDGALKLIDFSGCGYDGQPATACYEWFSYERRIPGCPVNVATDIFAFGCAAYEIQTGRVPFADLLEESEPRSSLVQRVTERYARGAFPDVSHLPLGDVARGCWTGAMCKYTTAELEMRDCNRVPKHKVVKYLYQRCGEKPKPGSRCTNAVLDTGLGVFLQSQIGRPCRLCRNSGLSVGTEIYEDHDLSTVAERT